MKRAIGFLGATATLLGFAACASVLGIEDYPGQDPALGECGQFVYADETCKACIDGTADAGEGCCEEAKACREDEKCGPFHDCLSACAVDDAACRIGCNAQFPTALSNDASRALSDCQAGSCIGSCSSCGALGDFIGPACAPCVDQACCDVSRVCTGSASCRHYLSCLATCHDPYCTSACALAEGSPATTPEFLALLSCLQGSCGSQCEIGTDFRCVGQFGRIAPKTSRTTVVATVTTLLAETLTKADEVRVAACPDRADPTCGGDQGQLVDADGKVTIDVKLTPNSGFGGYFYSQGFEPGRGGGKRQPLLPTYTIQSLPVIQSSETLRILTTDRPDLDVVANAVRCIPTDPSSPCKGTDPNKGVIFMGVVDCLVGPAPGIMFTVEAQGEFQQVYYTSNGLPSATATMTNVDGFGAAVDVPPGGMVTITARVAATNEVVSTLMAPMFAGTAMFAILQPMPSDR